MAPLLVAYCAVHAVTDRKRGLAEVRAWYLWPMGLAFLWLALCTSLITPALNARNVDYIALYDQLGSSASDILLNAIREPQRIAQALVRSLSQGNLVWALLFPFLCLPLLGPRWLLIAAPILLQHLLSWRSSEWMIYFHYGAPLLPLFWMAAVEGVASFDRKELLPPSVRRAVPLLLVLATLIAQIVTRTHSTPRFDDSELVYAKRTPRPSECDCCRNSTSGQRDRAASLPLASGDAREAVLAALHSERFENTQSRIV